MIAPELLRQIADKVAAIGVNEAVLKPLRDAFPGVHFSYCLEDDVGNAQPALHGEGFALYLIDAGDHCLKLTSDADVATGVLVAETVEE